jgi:RHS repeat-associated protein
LTLTIPYDFDGHSPSVLYRMPTVIAALSHAPTDLAPASKGDSFSYVHGPVIDDHRSRGRLGGDCHRQPSGRDEQERTSQWITELGLYDYRNRVYSAELGRFLQTDPIRFDAGDVNLCGYASNSPAKAVDPLGLISSVHTGPPAAAAAGWPPADIAETFGLSAAAAEALVKAQECKQLKSEVDSAKSDANRQVGCKKSDCPETLKKKTDAWKRLADARWNFNQKCWSGGDKGHQQAQQDAYRAWKKCNEILAKK